MTAWPGWPGKGHLHLSPGQKLYREKSEDAAGRIRYRTYAYACCHLKGVCAKGKRCAISCSGNEDLLGEIANHLESKRAEASILRNGSAGWKHNADLKSNHTLRRARYCGNLAVHIQALMAACAHNVCQLVKHLKTLTKHPPALAQLKREEPRMSSVG
ncbi:MAG: transposase [Clostridia bacterium]|nr:transposase [Clostridia bacterium]